MVHDLIPLWQTEHANFSRLLDLFEEQVSAFVEGGPPDYQLMLDIVSYLRESPDRFHHPREDVMFAQLALRDPSVQIPISRLLQERRVIALAGEDLRTRLCEVIAGSAVPRAALEAAAAIYLAYYRHHLATQERAILPRAAKWLTPQDWQNVADVLVPGSDPLFGDTPHERYQDLHQALAARTGHSVALSA